VEYVGLAELGIDIKDRILPIFISESKLKDLAIIERDEERISLFPAELVTE